MNKLKETGEHMTKKIYKFGFLIAFFVACGLFFTACSCGQTPPPPGESEGHINGIVVEVNNQSLVFDAETNTIEVEYGVADTIVWQNDLKVYSTFEEAGIERKEIEYKTNESAEGWTIATDIPISSIIPVSTYSLKVTYEEFEKDFTLNVVKGKVAVPTLEQSEFEYTGSAITPTILNQSALIQMLTTAQAMSVTSAINAGEYAIYFDLSNKLSYEWDITDGDKSAYQVLNWKINKKVLSAPEIEKTNADFISNGNITEFTYKYEINGTQVYSVSQGFKLNAEQNGLFVLENGTQTNASSGTSTAKLKLRDTQNYSFSSGANEIEYKYKINKKAMPKPAKLNDDALIYNNGALLVPQLNDAFIPELMTGLVGATNPSFEMIGGNVEYKDIINEITFKPAHANNFEWEGGGASAEIKFQIHRANFSLPQNISSSLHIVKDYAYDLKLEDINIYDFSNGKSDLTVESIEFLEDNYLIPSSGQNWNDASEFYWLNPETSLNVGENQVYQFAYSRNYMFFNDAVASISITVNKIQVDLSEVAWSGPSENELVYSSTLNPNFSLINLPNGITVENGGYKYFYSQTENGEYAETTIKNKAGYYYVTATLSYLESNFEIVNWTADKAKHSYFVKKAQVSLSGIELDENKFEYNAKAKDVRLIGLPEGVSAESPVIKYSQTQGGEFEEVEYAIEIGYYVAIFNLTFDTLNCEFTDAPSFISGNVATLDFEITKGRINLDNVEWSNSVFVFNGEYKNVTVVASSLPSGVTVGGYEHFVMVGDDDYQSTLNLGDKGKYLTKASLIFDDSKYALYLSGEPCAENVAIHYWEIIENVIEYVEFGSGMISVEALLSAKYMPIGKTLSLGVRSGYYVTMNGENYSYFSFDANNKDQDLVIEVFQDGAQDGDEAIYRQVIKCFEISSLFETLTLNGENYSMPDEDMISFGYGDKLVISLKEGYELTLNELVGGNAQQISGNIIEFNKETYAKTYEIEINIYGVLGVEKLDKTVSCVMINSVKIYGNDYGLDLNNNEVKVDLELNATSVDIILNQDEFIKNSNRLSYVLSGSESANGTFASNVFSVDVTKFNKIIIKFAFAEDEIIDLFSIEFLEFSPIAQVKVYYYVPSIYGYPYENSEQHPQTILTRADGQYGYLFGVGDNNERNIVSSVIVTLKEKYASEYRIELKLFNGEIVDFSKLGDKEIYINVLNSEDEVIYQDTLFINYVLILNVKGGANVSETADGEFEVSISSAELELEHNPNFDTPIINYITITLNGGEAMDLTQDGEYEIPLEFEYDINGTKYSLSSTLNVTKVSN